MRGFFYRALSGLLACFFLLFSGARTVQAEGVWQEAAEGIQVREFFSTGEGNSGSLTVVRVDTRLYDLRLAMATELGGGPDTVKGWAWKTGMVVAVNAGMYRADDTLRSTGFMRQGGHINNGYVNPAYGAFLVFGPDDPDLPRVRIVDRANESWKEIIAGYRIVIQNFRLVSSTRENLWPKKGKRISMAAVGMDGSGRLLFMHSAAPRTQYEFNELILGLPLDLQAAMYVEGGPEACLYVRTENYERLWTGSSGSGLWRTDARQLWPVPNVLGIVPR